MSIFDLSRLSLPSLSGFDYEAAVADRLARLSAELASAGVDYDAAGRETDPLVILEQADAYREQLAYAAMDAAVRSVLVNFARGADLEHQAARFGLARFTIYPATASAPAVLETDEALRRRVVLAPEQFAAAGSSAKYEFHARSADPGVRGVDVWSPGRGLVAVAVQAWSGYDEAAVVEAVRAELARPNVRALTDVLSVIAAPVSRYSVRGTLYIRPGPDSAVIRAEAEAAVRAELERRRVPGRDVSRSAIIAAASVGGVDRVVLDAPLFDLIAPSGDVLELEALEFGVLIHAG